MSLWDQKGIPHKGWTCVGMEDLGEDLEHLDAESRKDYYERCEMCSNEGIRYVHIMRHPEYPNELRVGQQCAEKMENDYANPHKRETALRNKTNRRLNFLRQSWRTNEKGNLILKYKGHHITIMQSRYGGYGVAFNNTFVWEHKGEKIRSIEKAKLVAFDIFDSKVHK
ncbi:MULTISPECIES: hypothetical protein [unclassified Paenibacillus]|uniref:hypothetical protein n=1 Tax=unclassified Paenibacillus TaxID=185978 RepID=UPI0021189F02|nr:MULTISPECIES: hypothetical protein [unclassified Paenibacillus]